MYSSKVGSGEVNSAIGTPTCLADHLAKGDPLCTSQEQTEILSISLPKILLLHCTIFTFDNI